MDVLSTQPDFGRESGKEEMTESAQGQRGKTGSSIKKWAGFSLRVLVLAATLFLTLMVVSSITAADVAAETNPQEVGRMMSSLFLASLVDATILALIVRFSRWRGLSLILGLALAFFGVQTVMGQIEALVFLTPLGENWGAGSLPMIEMPLELIISSIISGAAKAVVGVPAAALLFGKARGRSTESIELLPTMGWRQWLLKLAGVVLLYELLYFGFGYYVAWKSPAILEFYQGSDPGSFLAQMNHVLTETPRLAPFQAMRSLLWTAFAFPIVRMFKDKPLFGSALSGLLLGVLAFSHTIVPNPYMPDAVRQVHLIETVSSTFLFGLAQYWLFHRAHRSLAGMFGLENRSQERSSMQAV